MFQVHEGVMTSGYRALDIINTVVIVLICTTMIFQMLYFFMFFVKVKKYPKAKNYHKFGIIVCARNEEKVVGNLLDSLNKQDYPKDKYDVFVVCHNCSDKTKDVAVEYGATPIVITDNDPNHARKGYALKDAFDQYLNNYDHEAYIIFDADNLAAPNFVSKMNDAFDSGVDAGQGHINFQNMEENVMTEINSIFHLRDASFNHRGRSFIHSTCCFTGTGYFFSRKVLDDIGGWNFTNFIEDAEFTCNLALKGYSAKFIDDAMFYDEQSSHLMESLGRQARMGKGCWTIFFKYGPRLLWKFFTTFKIKYLDLFLTYSYPPCALLCTLWFPFYYIFVPVRHLIMGNVAFFNEFLLFIVQMVGLYILIPLTIQNIILYLMNYKRSHLKSVSKSFVALLLWPFYNIFISVAITYGIFNPKLKWVPTKHKSNKKIEEVEKS